MCLIIAKKKKKVIDGTFFENCLLEAFKNNYDSIGYTIKNEKGKLSSFLHCKPTEEIARNVITEVLNYGNHYNREFVVHLRKTSVGAITCRNAQPIILDKSIDLNNFISYRKSEYIGKALAHNGTIYNYITNNSLDSDSRYLADLLSINSVYKYFLQGYFLQCQNILPKGNPLKPIMSQIFSSRFAIISSFHQLILIDNWFTENGLYFSNDGYKKKEIMIYSEHDTSYYT